MTEEKIMWLIDKAWKDGYMYGTKQTIIGGLIGMIGAFGIFCLYKAIKKRRAK